ncbi:MAG: FKBP-type peptidyl-prolyl cis-trans isomerase [Tidjanibacter sp.]|nr:FKBP-type peptidyl-prolyl cis-trans isomerase [Tidjanibacter sp.]
MKKLFVILASVAMVASFASCSGGKSLKSDVDSLSYALGTDFGNSLAQIKGQMEDELDMNLFYKGVNDAMKGEPKIAQEEAFAFLRDYFNVKAPQKALAASQKYLDEVAARKGVQKTESGLLYQVVREGNNDKKAVNPTDEVRVVYEGKLKNGKVFDSSYERGDTVSFKLNQVIKGWAEGIQLVGEGGEIDLWIPADLAYGQRAPQQIGPNQALQFKVELVEVIPDTTAVEEQK